MRKPKTHFEQIPIVAVLRAAPDVARTTKRSRVAMAPRTTSRGRLAARQAARGGGKPRG